MDRLYELLDRTDNVDCLVIHTSGMHSLSEPSYFEYFAGVSAVGERNALIVSESGGEVIVVDLLRDIDRVERHSTVDDVRGARTFAEEVSEVVDELSTDGGVVVAGVDRMPSDVYEALEARNRNVERMDDEVGKLTYEKTPTELDIFRELGRITGAGFRTAFETIRPGMKEYEVAAEIERAMRAAGAEDNFNLYGSYPRNDLLHGPRDRIMQEGDVFLCELSPMVEGYVLQITRTIVVGTPDPVVPEKFSLLEEALQRTKSRLEAGVEASVISKTMNNVFRKEGYDEYCRPPYMRTRGHEFGFGPIGMSITEETETVLTEGMVLVIHPNQYIPETGYLALGDPVLITDDGSETLTNVDPRLFTKEVIQ